MFNEILTGKQTLEPTPVPESPYRVQSVPQATATTARCADCHVSFKPHAYSGIRCSMCHAALVRRNEVESARILAAAEAQAAASDRSMRLFKWAGFAVLGVCLALIKGQMRSQIREDEEQRAAASMSYVPSYSDEYSRDLYYLEGDACRCEDLKCARDVQARVTQTLSRTRATDDTADEQGRRSLEKIGDCVAQFEH
jgi:hypothetical protein